MTIRDLIYKLINLINKANGTEKQADQEDQGFQEFKEKAPKNVGKIKTLLLIPVIVIAIFAIMSCQYTVEETEQAVVTTLGKVTSVESAGLHFKLPFPIQDVTKVEVNRTQKLQIGYSSKSEGQGYSDTTSVLGESKMITGDTLI